MEKRKSNDNAICVWCGSLGLAVGAVTCSPECKTAWSQVCTDPVVAAERDELERLAPFYEKLDKWTKRRFDESRRMIWKIGRIKFGLQERFPDGTPLCSAQSLPPVPEVDSYAMVTGVVNADYCFSIQAGWTENPFDRLVHGLLSIHESTGRIYNELIKPDTRVTEEVVKRLKFDRACEGLVADAEEAATMQMVEPPQLKVA
jgi:hypothetical protein